MLGCFRSGLMLVEGAIPRLPASALPRSERISPKRFDPTTTSRLSGCNTKRAAIASTSPWSESTSGCAAAIRADVSSPPLPRERQGLQGNSLPPPRTAQVAPADARVFAFAVLAHDDPIHGF